VSINPRTITTLVNEDQSWIGPGGISAFQDNQSIVLDRSAFDLVTAFPNGYIPSGVVLGKITATGLYAPYAGNSNEVQTFTRTSTGGTVTVTFEGETTTALAATAAGFTAAVLQAGLLALSNLEPGDVTVTGADGGPLVVTFGGNRLGENVSAMTVDNTSATGGTITVAQTTAGGSAASSGAETPAGFLAVSVPMSRDGAATDDEAGALYWHGQVDTSELPTGHGLDATARNLLAAKFSFI
jgi:hypothetical protein